MAGRDGERLRTASRRGHADTAAALLSEAAASHGTAAALAWELLRVSSVEDAARDLLALARAAEAWTLEPTACRPAAASELWTQLMQVASVLLASLEPTPSLGSTTGSKSVDVSAMNWDEFVGLPYALDTSALQKTKDGRALLQEVDEIVALQQWRLTQPDARDFQEPSGGEPSVCECLEEAIRRLERCRPVMVPATPEVAVDTDTNDLKCVFFECDDASILCGVHVGEDGNATFRVSDSDDEAQDPIDVIISELQGIHDVLALSVRVATLLGRQRKTGVWLHSLADDTTLRDWEQGIRKEINSLTSVNSGNDTDPRAGAVTQMLRYAALAPASVLDTILGSAITTTYHHAFFARFFAWCPLLLSWTDYEDSWAPSSWILSALLEELARIVSVHDPSLARPIDDCCAFQFLLELSVRTDVLDCDAVLESVFGPVLNRYAEVADPRPLTRLFDLLHRYLAQSREHGRVCSVGLLAKYFSFVGEHYKRVYTADQCGMGNVSKRVIEFRDVALLLCQEIAMACPPETLNDWSYDVPAVSLCQAHGIRTSALEEAEPTTALSDSLGHTKASIQQLVWSLIWATGRSSDRSNVPSRLACIVGTENVDSSSGLTATGASLVQSTIAGMLFASGARSFDWILKVVETELLSTTRGLERCDGASTPDLTAPQELSEYVVRCWCLGAFSDDGLELEAVVWMLEQAARTFDRAIETATGDPSKLFRCLQMLGLVNASLLRITAVDQAQAIFERLEIAAVRVLFLLARLPSSSLPHPHDETSFRQAVAAVLVESRLVESEAVTRFLQTTAQRD